MARADVGGAIDGLRRRPGFGALQPADDGNLSLGRRVGVLVVLAALGGAIILAAGGVQGDHIAVAPVVTPSPQPSVAVVADTFRPVAPLPLGVPTIRTPKVTLRSDRTIDLRVNVPETATLQAGLEIHVYRDDKVVAVQPVTHTGRVKVVDVPLRQGSNHLTAALASSGGEGPRSTVVTLDLDARAPKMTLKSPRSGKTMDEPRVRIRGKTEAGLTVIGKNSTSKAKVTTESDPKTGAFQLDMDLAKGRNAITVHARDAAGNRGAATIIINRGKGRIEVNLKVSPRNIPLASIPRSLRAQVTARDRIGQPIAGAQVTFSITPPGLLTTTYQATTNRDGVATWSGLRLVEGTTKGDGLLTALVEVAGAEPTSRTVTFTVW